MHSELGDSESAVAPLLGSASAAAMIAIAAERFAIKRHVVALGGAAIAFAASQASTGTARELLQGAALGSLGVAIFELVRTLRQDTAEYHRTRPAMPPSSAPEGATLPVPSTDATAAAPATTPAFSGGESGASP